MFLMAMKRTSDQPVPGRVCLLFERIGVVFLLGGLVATSGSLAMGQAAPTEERASRKPASDPGTGDNSVTQVVAEGVGATADEALKDAFRNAVSQVVGAVVDAETLVENDEVVNDKVLTYSDGLIKRYAEVPGTKKFEKNLHRIKIKADVERKSVVAKLKAANVTLKEVDGKGLFAEAVTRVEGEADAKALIANLFKDYPANVIQGVVKGKPSVETAGGETTVKCEVQVSVEPTKYKAFQEKAVELLRNIAIRKGEVFAQAEPRQSVSSRARSLKLEADVLQFTEQDRSSKPNPFPNGWWSQKLSESDEMVLVVNTKSNERHDRTTWQWFHVPRPGDGIDKQRRRRASDTFSKQLAVDIFFLGSDGQEIVRDSRQLSTASDGNEETQSPGLYAERRRWSDQNWNVWFAYISPFRFLADDRYVPQMSITSEVKVTPAELKAISTIKVEVRVVE